MTVALSRVLKALITPEILQAAINRSGEHTEEIPGLAIQRIEFTQAGVIKVDCTADDPECRYMTVFVATNGAGELIAGW